MKIIKIIGAVIVVVIAISIIRSCSATPSYDIYNVEYDPVQKVLTWDDDSNAKSWLVSINGAEEVKVSSRSFAFNAEDQDFTFRIEGLHKKKGHDINPVASGTMRFLGTPQNLRIEDGRLVWDPVAGVQEYLLYNFGNEYGYANTNSASIPSGSFSFTVQSLGGDGYFYSYQSAAFDGVLMDTPTGLTYANGILRWNAVSGAGGYMVKIDGTEHRVEDASFAFPGTGKDFTISISSIATGENAYNSAPLEMTCYYLGKIDSFSFNENGDLIWDPLPAAQGYHVRINGAEAADATSALYSGFALDTPYTVEITPYTSELSYGAAPTAYTFEKLSAVTNAVFNPTENVITWDAHPRATAYELMVNGETKQVFTNSCAVPRMDRDLTFTVKAVGSGENSFSYFAEERHYTYIAPVTDVSVRDGKLVWGASERATGYRLAFLDGTVATSPVPEYTAITPGQQYVVTVTPYTDDPMSFSYPSGEFPFTVLAAPVLSYSQRAVLWNQNPSAGGYYVQVLRDGQPFDTRNLGATELMYANEYTGAGRYQVTVKAVSSTGHVYDSAYSEPFEIVRLSAPTGHTIDNNAEASDRVQITVTGVNESQSYRVLVNGTEHLTTTSTSFGLDLLSLNSSDGEVVFKISVQAVGQPADSRIAYLDSIDTYAFNLTRLATPKNLRLDGNVISWDRVNNTSTYLVAVGGKTYRTNTTSLTLTELAAGDHEIRVQALSENSTYMTGRQSEAYRIKKLPKVSGLRMVTTSSGDRRVQWDEIAGVSAYTVKVGQQSMTAAVNVFSIGQYLTGLKEGEAIQISVFARGDGHTTLDSEPSDTMAVCRFAAPSAIAVSGEMITWNSSVSNNVTATNYALEINGQIYNATGTSYSTAELPAGAYAVRVKALGDNVSSLDSGFSSSIRVVKLAEPANIRFEVGGRTLSWDPVAEAEEYIITVDDQVIHQSGTTLDIGKYISDATHVGMHSIKIQARSSAPNTIMSMTAEYTFKAVALTAPRYVSEGAERGTFTVVVEGQNAIVTVAVPTVDLPAGALQYSYSLSGTADSKTESNTYTGFLEYSEFDYNIQVTYIVNCFAADGTYYISSNPSERVTVQYIPAS